MRAVQGGEVGKVQSVGAAIGTEATFDFARCGRNRCGRRERAVEPNTKALGVGTKRIKLEGGDGVELSLDEVV